MRETNGWWQFVLASLAAWRITHLLAKEDGPADVIARFRERLGDRPAGKLMDCFDCLGLWVAAPVSLLAFRRRRLLVWLALSGAASLIERAIGAQPVVIQPLPEVTKGESNNGMLRPETSGGQ